MTGSIQKSIIFLFLHFQANDFTFWKFTSATFIPIIRDSELAFNTGKSELWSPFGGFTWDETKLGLGNYLRKSMEDKQRSEAFFCLPATDQQDSPPGIEIFQQLNLMLQSEIISWTTKLQDIFRIESSYKKEFFWLLMGELASYMPTPAIQVTIIQVEKESRNPWETEEIGMRTDQDDCLTEVMQKCRKVLKEHIISLKHGIETERIMNIFTTQEQEKLGDFKISLQNDWSVFEEIELCQHFLLFYTSVTLYKHTHQDLPMYLHTDNTVEGILETQAVLVSLIKLKKRNDLKVHELPYELNQVYGKWINKYINELTDKFINSINSLNEIQLQSFEGTQVRLVYGLLVSIYEDHTEIKKVITFWIRYMDFYLGINHLKDLLYPIDSIEKLIIKDINHMEYIMNEFQKISNPSINQKNLLNRFLEFFLEKTEDLELRQIALDGLLKIQKIKDQDSLKSLLQYHFLCLAHFPGYYLGLVMKSLEFVRVGVRGGQQGHKTSDLMQGSSGCDQSSSFPFLILLQLTTKSSKQTRLVELVDIKNEGMKGLECQGKPMDVV
ncbi:uncharacterized protein MELLADRAFT_101019 [Melampsora larici-populina 98AG31]|uniref:Uncharacterized protein n=1 Tax=Melampsora larici-populina (strain 98AG31 / pathotype 3-4-7) TaxID=747676 RepID=F4R3D0_MELLP|nr:uncharacterized protein MELLADRAFT_101019 [Melampsora larici-populina 98AG31]EGG13191.1 hypothetical protein MELLADRAFT_101019 [Melampsora larici-populina 98AG31]